MELSPSPGFEDPKLVPTPPHVYAEKAGRIAGKILDNAAWVHNQVEQLAADRERNGEPVDTMAPKLYSGESHNAYRQSPDGQHRSLDLEIPERDAHGRRKGSHKVEITQSDNGKLKGAVTKVQRTEKVSPDENRVTSHKFTEKPLRRVRHKVSDTEVFGIESRKEVGQPGAAESEVRGDLFTSLNKARAEVSRARKANREYADAERQRLSDALDKELAQSNT